MFICAIFQKFKVTGVLDVTYFMVLTNNTSKQICFFFLNEPCETDEKNIFMPMG